ncbi:MAG: sulfatase-like hydrolase/transferase [Candidatus Altiarchaeales archaeon]|nr:sulfatase-like hydrolase/transferase [Candidatus Altiarchaeales archaeon]
MSRYSFFLFLVIAFSAGCLESNHREAGDGVLGGVFCPDCNVILISIDTLRADHLGAYGYNRETSAGLDEFAAKSLLFENAYSQATFTLSSHASLLTGLYAEVHDAEVYRGSGLNDDLTLMAEVFKQEGYDTLSFNGGGAIDVGTNIQQGFRVYETGGDLSNNFNKTRNWISENGSRRFFIFIHGYDVHTPYFYPGPFYREINPESNVSLKEFRGRIKPIHDCLLRYPDNNSVCVDQGYPEEEVHISSNVWNAERNHSVSSCNCSVEVLTALYDDGIYYVDGLFSRFMAELEGLGKLENTIIIVTSDHGEELGERGEVARHGHTVYNELTHVPLIIYVPKQKPKRIEKNAELVDVMPTLFSITGIKYDGVMQGEDLTKTKAGNLAYSEIKYYNLAKKTLVEDDLKIILTHKKNYLDFYGELYNLSQDPGETQSLHNTEGMQGRAEEIIEKLSNQALANEKLKEEINPKRYQIRMNEKQKKRLRDLRYLR